MGQRLPICYGDFIDEVSWLPDTKIVAQWNGIHNVKVSRS